MNEIEEEDQHHSSYSFADKKEQSEALTEERSKQIPSSLNQHFPKHPASLPIRASDIPAHPESGWR